jgi:hypothetical protein
MVVKNCNFLLFWWVGVLCITFLCWNYVIFVLELSYIAHEIIQLSLWLMSV